MAEEGLLSGMTGGGLFVWERGMLMPCLMRTMRQTGLFRQMDVIPQPPSRYSSWTYRSTCSCNRV